MFSASWTPTWWKLEVEYVVFPSSGVFCPTSNKLSESLTPKPELEQVVVLIGGVSGPASKEPSESLNCNPEHEQVVNPMGGVFGSASNELSESLTRSKLTFVETPKKNFQYLCYTQVLAVTLHIPLTSKKNKGAKWTTSRLFYQIVFFIYYNIEKLLRTVFCRDWWAIFVEKNFPALIKLKKSKSNLFSSLQRLEWRFYHQWSSYCLFLSSDIRGIVKMYTNVQFVCLSEHSDVRLFNFNPKFIYREEEILKPCTSCRSKLITKVDSVNKS